MYFDYASTTRSTPNTSRIRIAKTNAHINARTDRNIHSQEVIIDENDDYYDFESEYH